MLSWWAWTEKCSPSPWPKPTPFRPERFTSIVWAFRRFPLVRVGPDHSDSIVGGRFNSGPHRSLTAPTVGPLTSRCSRTWPTDQAQLPAVKSVSSNAKDTEKRFL